MTDPRRLSDLELEGELRLLGAAYPYPPTPNLAVAVRARIVAAPRPARRPVALWRDPWRLALAAAVLLILLGSAALINPATRDAIAHFFHVRGVVVNRVPSPPPTVTPITPLNLGQERTLDQAQALVAFPIVVPPQLGPPDAVYVNQSIPGGEVALAYKPRPGISLVPQTGLGVLVTEFRGDLVPGRITKEGGPGTVIEEMAVNGNPGYWLGGDAHAVIVHSQDRDFYDMLRLAANTLVWEHNGVTYRIESSLSKDETLRLAAGMP